jgi:NhaP-type Na+/H+ or K+/H+ antiporter
MYSNLAILAVFGFAFSAVAGRIERSRISGPIIFIFFGLLAGPLGLGLINFDIEAVEMRVIADLTLALVLFIDAANANLSTLRTHAIIPRRMLLFGLPLCIALGAWTGTVRSACWRPCWRQPMPLWVKAWSPMRRYRQGCVKG